MKKTLKYNKRELTEQFELRVWNELEGWAYINCASFKFSPLKSG